MTMRRLWRGRFGAIAMVAGLAGALTPTGAGAQVPPPGQACFDEHPCQLSSLPDDDRQVLGVFPSADGERVVYLADQDTYGVLELYSVPVAEGQRSTRLNLPRTRISGVEISPDGTRVLYVAHTEPGGPGDPGPASLFSVPIAGPASASVRLVVEVAETAFHVPGYRISPDSGKVIYAPPARDRLMVVPIDGPASARQRLTDRLVAGGAVFEFDVSANSKSLVYRADQDTLSVAELYRVPLTLSRRRPIRRR